MSSDRRRVSARTQGPTSGPAQLLLTLQLVQHTHLLCAAVHSCAVGVGDDGGLIAVRRTLACESVASQDMDIQHRGNTHHSQFCDDLRNRATIAAGGGL